MMMVPSDVEDVGAPALRPIETNCWGAQLNGGMGCVPNFVPGKLHFKNNFCDNCRESIIVPLAYVRALNAEQAECFHSAISPMGLRYRGFHDGSGKKHVAAQLAGALAPHTPHFLGPRPHLRNRTGAPLPTHPGE